MSEDTKKIVNINFKDFIAQDVADCMDSFFNMLSDNGVPVAISADEFCADDDVMFNSAELSYNLVWWGKWLSAKVAGFEALSELGFEGVKNDSDHCEKRAVKPLRGTTVFEGEWCRREGVIFARYQGAIEVTNASEANTKLRRHKADLQTAEFLLAELHDYWRRAEEAA